MKSGRILTVHDHDRDSAAMTYVYPVVSRRAGGVSIGINLNPNNACNFRCVYCQVPNLRYGKAPSIDLALLEEELTTFLTSVVSGDFMLKHVPEHARTLRDVAFSGNGEPTSVDDFRAVVEVVIKAMHTAQVPDDAKLRLITNGSGGDRDHVLAGLSLMNERNGEVWFKLDSGDDDGMLRVNQVHTKVSRHLERLRAMAPRCPTWIQTCMFARNGLPPTEGDVVRWIEALKGEVKRGTPIEGVYLYGLARQSFQPEAAELGAVSEPWLRQVAERTVRETGLQVIAKV